MPTDPLKSPATDGARSVLDGARAAAEQAGDAAGHAGEAVQRSQAYRWMVQLGLCCYGVVHLLIAFLALQILQGKRVEASNQGSLATLSALPLGHALIVAVGIGMAALTVWMVLEAAFGYRWLDGTKRIVRRVASAFRAIVYASISAAALTLTLGGRVANGNANARQQARDVLALPGGQALLVVVAIGTAIAAGDQIQRGVRRSFLKYDLQGTIPPWAQWLGIVGWVAKGITLLAVAGLFAAAAFTDNPSRAGGFDMALRSLRGHGPGQLLLLLVAVGTACFGVFCFFWSAHPRHDARAD